MIPTAEVKARLQPEPLLKALGLLGDRRTFKRQPRGFLIRCPAHDDRTPSCSVQERDGVVLWKCHACGATGDAIKLIETVRGSSFQDALAEAAGLVGVTDDAPPTHDVAPQRPTEPDRDYPPLAEVQALWSEAVPLDAEASAWAKDRAISASAAAEYVRSIPPGVALPRWASYRGSTWRETGHRLLMPMYDHWGQMRSLRAIRVVDGDSPKRLPPAGHKAAGLVMACDMGVAMLRGSFEAPRVLILEGEPDFLFWAARSTTLVYARIGIVSGSWSADFARRIPRSAEVHIHTDLDKAGEKYAQDIVESLPTHRLFRWKPGGGS